jgi:hypothetical protein
VPPLSQRRGEIAPDPSTGARAVNQKKMGHPPSLTHPLPHMQGATPHAL